MRDHGVCEIFVICWCQLVKSDNENLENEIVTESLYAYV